MTLSFTLTKLISAILLPVPITLLLMLAACLSTKRTQQIIFTGLACVILGLAGWAPIANMLLTQLEQPYHPVMTIPKDVDTVIILGAGVRSNTVLPANTQLNSASISRLVEGVRLYEMIQKHHEHAHLTLLGGRVFLSPNHSGILENTAHILGVSTNDITLARGYANTSDEAKHLKKTLKEKPFFLVTSAYHMTRALYLFHQQGMHPIPAPTQFLSKQHSIRGGLWWTPRASNIVHVDIALHEYLGLLWAKLTS